MNSSHHPNTPEEDEIEDLLIHFKPKPTHRFFQRMQSAPWLAPNRSILAVSKWPRRYLLWGTAGILIAILISTILFIPSINAIAKQIIYSFLSAPTNQIEVQVTPSNPGELFNLNDPANFTLSVADAEKLAGFPLKQISPIPENLSLVGARYDPNYKAVILNYQGENFTLFITQRLLGKGQDVFSIGQGAEIKLVKIGDIQGEYVEGGWKTISSQPSPGNQTAESPIDITAVWDNALAQSTLRWLSANTTYELRAVGEGRPSQSELINWANELK